MKTLCLTCSKRRISSKSVILLNLWYAMMFVHNISMRCIGSILFNNSNIERYQSQYNVYGIGLCLVYLSFPLFGLLADVKTGRYKPIMTSVHFSFLSWIIGGLTIIVKTYFPENDILFFIAFGIGFLLELIGICCFFSNIVQFSLDQVIGASADELSAIIYYWEEDYPSRLDLSKEKYGGPFSVEQVEDVKTVLRLIPLLISIVGLFCAREFTVNCFSILNKTPQFISCFILNDSSYFSVAVVLILLYQLLIYPCFYKFIPSMLKRIGLGLIFALLTTLYYVIMLACKDSLYLNITSYKAVVVPQILYGIAYAFIIPSSLEFTIAQCPHEMRGVLVGLWYAADGFGYFINVSGKYLFSCQGERHCQSLYYYVLKSVIILIILIMFLILGKCYKFRVRENEVNVHLIAEEHYERYLDQEVQYRREMGLSFESTD